MTAAPIRANPDDLSSTITRRRAPVRVTAERHAQYRDRSLRRSRFSRRSIFPTRARRPRPARQNPSPLALAQPTDP